MINLEFKLGSGQLTFDLTCDHENPLLFNAYSGSFNKDYIELQANKQVIPLFNRYDDAFFNERVTDNGSRFEPLEKGIRVYMDDVVLGCAERLNTSFMDAVYQSLERFLKNALNNSHKIVLRQEDQTHVMLFNPVNVVFSIKGCNNYIVCLSLNDELSTHMLKRMVAEDGMHSELHELIVDSISETCNTVVGNAFSVFADCKETIRLGVPLIFRFVSQEQLVSNVGFKMKELVFGDFDVKLVVIDLDEVLNG